MRFSTWNKSISCLYYFGASSNARCRAINSAATVLRAAVGPNFGKLPANYFIILERPECIIKHEFSPGKWKFLRLSLVGGRSRRKRFFDIGFGDRIDIQDRRKDVVAPPFSGTSAVAPPNCVALEESALIKSRSRHSFFARSTWTSVPARLDKALDLSPSGARSSHYWRR